MSISTIVVVVIVAIAITVIALWARRRLSRPRARLTRSRAVRPDPTPLAMREAETEEAVEAKKDLVGYYFFVLTLTIVAFGILATLAGITLAYWNDENQTVKDWAKVAMWTVITAIYFLMLLKYISLSVMKKPEDRLAILLIMGRFSTDLPSGPIVAPYWITDIKHIQTKMFEIDIPDSPEWIDHSDPNKKADGRPGDGTVKENYTPALRVQLREKVVTGETFTPKCKARQADGSFVELSAAPIPKNSSLTRPQTVEVGLSVGYRVTNLLKFWTKVGTSDDAERLIRDHVVSGVNRELPGLCPIEVTSFTSVIEQNMKLDLCDYTRDWGIEIVKHMLWPIGFSHEFNTALVQVAQAVELKKKKITDAEGDREARILIGQGDGEYEKDLLTGRAQGQAELVKVSMRDGHRTLALTTSGDALGRSTVIASDPMNLAGLAAGGLTVLDKLQGGNKSRIVLTDGEDGGDNTPPPTPPTQAPKPTQTNTQAPPPQARHDGGARKRRRR